LIFIANAMLITIVTCVTMLEIHVTVVSFDD
jgi:hypothetical protein